MLSTDSRLALFIDQKGQQLVYFVKGFLEGSIPFPEIQLFINDVLQEWDQIHIHQQCPYTRKEPVFWHLLFMLERWPERKLKGSWVLRRQLYICAAYISDAGVRPERCCGGRP